MGGLLIVLEPGAARRPVVLHLREASARGVRLRLMARAGHTRWRPTYPHGHNAFVPTKAPPTFDEFKRSSPWWVGVGFAEWLVPVRIGLGI